MKDYVIARSALLSALQVHYCVLQSSLSALGALAQAGVVDSS